MELADRSMNATALRSWEKQTGNFHANRIRREADRVAEIGDRHEEFKDKVIRCVEGVVSCVQCSMISVRL